MDTCYYVMNIFSSQSVGLGHSSLWGLDVPLNEVSQLFFQYISYFGKTHFWKLSKSGGLCDIASAASEASLAGFIPDNTNITQESL